MALSYYPSIGFTVTIPDATTVVRVGDPAYGEYAQDPVENTQSIVLYNLDSAQYIWIQFAEGGLNPNEMTVNNCTVLPPGGAITLDVGQVGQRENVGEPELPGFNYPIVGLYARLDPALAGADVLLNVTYLQQRGFNPTN